MIPAPAKPEFCQLATEPSGGRYRHHCAHCRLTVATGRPTQPYAAGLPPPPHGQPTTPTSHIVPNPVASLTEPLAPALGLPTCTQDQIDGRLSICEACPYFNGQLCTHASCGCNVSAEPKFLNKLAWADQHCPMGRW